MPARETSLHPKESHKIFQNSLFERLANSERFLVYQDAFRAATGLPLAVVRKEPRHRRLVDLGQRA
jgi:hypothetical protein